MANSLNREFDIPTGFVEESVESQLYCEDLNEDEELWLIRMPSDIELSLLDRKKILLSDITGHAEIKEIKVENGKLLECYSECCEIPNLNVILPQKADKKLRTINKKFKGTVLISEGIVLEENKEIKLEDEIRLKEKEIKPENEPIENTQCLTQGKKSKKKKRHSHYSEDDLNHEINGVEIPSSNERKKQVKKHSDAHKVKSLDIEIKNEPLLMDLDSFPICNSQKQ